MHEMRELRAAFVDVDDLREGLQQALELELATIPPYLYALWSIVDRRSRAAQLIVDVVAEEMLHMALVANILNAVGGVPRLADPAAVPSYPCRLPGGVQQGLIVGLRRCDPAQLEVFKKIETPEKPVDVQQARVAGQPVTIGQFYDGLAATIDELGPSIFTGDPGRQLREWPVQGEDELRAIDGPADARRAITLIKQQGEGASEYDPADRDGELGHYYLFWEIIEGRDIVLQGTRWAFAGDPIPFPDTFPVADNPTVASLPAGSQAQALAMEFNESYRNLMAALERTFDGRPDQLGSALGLMYALRVQALDLFKHPSGRGDGTVAGPTFEYTPPGEPVDIELAGG